MLRDCLQLFFWNQIVKPLIFLDLTNRVNDDIDVIISFVLSEISNTPSPSLFNHVNVELSFTVFSESVLRQLLGKHVLTHMI